MIKTSIIILTHNAPAYVEKTLSSLNEITDAGDLLETETVVLDNASEKDTLDLLNRLKEKGYINKLFFSEENTFFARGNNIAVEMSGPSRYVLLLNSDIFIKNPKWLYKLIEYKEDGGYVAASFGRCSNPDRADGYCLLIDRNVYEEYRLDENFPWWGGVTKLQAQIISEGKKILAIDDHDDIIYHYGGKSGNDFKNAGSLDDRYEKVLLQFRNNPGFIDVVHVGKGSVVSSLKKKIKKVIARLKRL